MEKEGQLNIWILKPVGKSRGRGISVINDIMQVKYSEPVVLQKYLKTPLLLDGYKFDMRIYALVTSITPLEVYVYKEGFARLSTAPYSLDESDLKNLYIHLTNTSVQKYNHNANNQTSDAIIGGTKISLKTLRTRLEFKGIKWQTIWDQVGEIIVKSLVAVQGEIQPNPNCFELFGYDIIIDRDQKCWLLEVNSSPSLERMNILDDLIKQQLIDDIIDLVGPINFDRKRFCQVLERRIQEEQRVKSTINTSNNSK
jgi:tubulin polyglutamylase TTLL5